MYMYRCISISFEFKDNCLYNDLIRHIERIYNIIVVCLFFSWRKQKEKKKERESKDAEPRCQITYYAEDSMKTLPLSMFFFSLVRHNGNNSLVS